MKKLALKKVVLRNLDKSTVSPSGIVAETIGHSCTAGCPPPETYGCTFLAC